MPWASTRIVPSGLEEVLTVAPAAPVAPDEPAVCVELVVLLELLPHAASTTEAARARTTSYSGSRMASLPIWLEREHELAVCCVLSKTPSFVVFFRPFSRGAWRAG